MTHDDFMFFETFKDDIDNFQKVFGDTAAEILALDIIYYGVKGERKTKKEDVDYVHNILMEHNIKIHIDKSKERFERAKEENEKSKWKKKNQRRIKTMSSEIRLN